MFEACLSLPRDAREARLIADSLDALVRALREWPIDAWRRYESPATAAGLFERLVLRTKPFALDPIQRTSALHSAEAASAVLRVLWPHTPSTRSDPDLAFAA